MSGTSVLAVINTTGLDYDDRLRKEAQSLRRLGANVRVLALEYANLSTHRLVYDGVPATTVRLRTRHYLARGRGGVLKTLEMYACFLGTIARTKPDVVWIHDLGMAGLVPVLALLRCCGAIRRLVWDQHELPSDTLLGRGLYRRLYGILVGLCDAVVMANQERRSLVLHWLGRPPHTPIEVLENFPDSSFTDLAVQPLPDDVTEWLNGHPFLLAQGGANPDRHLGALVSAVLRESQFRLVVVGPYLAHCLSDLERIHGSAFGRRVLFTDAVPQMELARFIDHAYASVILYQARSANTRLCAPNRLYQALTRGVPVLVGSNPPMAELVNRLKCGVVLETDGGDVDDLCDGLRRLQAGYQDFRRNACGSPSLGWESQVSTVGRAAGMAESVNKPTVCLLPVVSDARIHRRLAALVRFGLKPTALAFDRPYYPGQPLPCPSVSLGAITHGRYLSRVRSLLGALSTIRTACLNADVVYAFSLDLLASAWLATRPSWRRPRFVYEVADIHPFLVGSGMRARLLRAFERRLLRDTGLIVVTSEAYISGFYRDVQRLTGLNYELVENKPDLDGSDRQVLPRSRPSAVLTIGYFGLLRCEQSWRVLLGLAMRGQGRIRVSLRGVPLKLSDFASQAAACPWIDYGGAYASPRDLPGIYERVDLVWIAHRLDDNNSFLWNRLNRFYESCAFHKPMIAQAGTQDGRIVSDSDLGLTIDLTQPTAAIESILAVTDEDLRRWEQSVARLPKTIYQENGEHERLSAQIRRLANAV